MQRARWKDLTDEQVKTITEMRTSGVGQKEIANAVGETKDTISRFLKERSIKKPLLVKVCGKCGIEYESHRVESKYCSKACRISAWQEVKNPDWYGFCEYCGKLYVKADRSNRRCSPKCYHKATTRTQANIVSEVEDIYDGEIEVISEYTGILDELTIRCKVCGLESTKKAEAILHNKSGCAHCNTSSHAEKEIEKILNELGVNFGKEIRFSHAKHMRRYRYDFAVFDDKGGIKLLIEYDGSQHFRAVDYFGGEAYLKRIQKNDRIKTEFAESIGIEVMRIPYTQQSNLESILTAKVKKNDYGR